MNKLSTLVISALAAFAGTQALAQTGRISTVGITTGVVAVTERTASNANAPVTNTNQPVYVGDNLAGLTFFNGNPGIDGTPTNASVGSPTSGVLFTLTGSLIPGGAATDLHAFMGYGTNVGPPTQAATYNDVAPLLAANSTYAGLTFAEPNLYPGGPAPLKANEFYTIHHAVNGTDYLAAIVPFTGGGSAVQDIKPMSWQGGVAATPANTSTINGYLALTFAAPTPAGPYFANLFYYLRTDTSGNTQFGYVIPALVSTQLDTLNLTTATGGFGVGNYKALVFSPVAFGGYAASQFYYLREDTGAGRTGNTILGRLDTTPGNRTISDIANLGGVYRTLTYVFDATGTAPAWGNNQLFVAGAPLAAGAQSISFAAVTPIDRNVGVPFSVTPTASSGLGITLTVASSSTGSATIVSPLGGVGTFTVTPTSPGIVTLRATQAGQVAPLVLTNFLEQSFNVAGPITTLVIPTKSLTAGTAAVSFIPVTATGGTGAITFSILPLLANGTLSFNTATGAITGTPAGAAAATNYTVTATDATLASSSKTFSLTVNPALTANLAVATTTVTTNVLASPFTPVTAVGGTSPFTFTVTPLPAGLTLSATIGQITGTPTVVTAAANYTVTITDAANATANQAFGLTVAGPAAVAPSITTQPAAQTVLVGATATFTVAATGTAPLAYQWRKAGVNVGTNSSTLTITNAQAVDAGSYDVVVSNGVLPNATSSAATLTVSAAPIAPSITTQPGNQAVTVGQTAAFTVVAAGTSPLAYQWRKGGTNISGATNATLTLTNAQLADAGIYDVIVSNGVAPNAASNTVTLTIAPAGVAPIITSPTSAAGTVSTPFVTYVIVATGTPTSFGATGLPAGISVNSSTGAINGIPTTAGVTVATLSATNSFGTDTDTLTITIAPAGIAPLITSPLNATGTVGTPFVTYNIVATNSPTSYAATGLPAGLAINGSSGAINGTPTSTGTSVVTLIAQNSTGSGTATLTITVAPAGIAPVITSPLTAAGTVGTPFVTYTIVATNSPTSYAATSLPVGLAVNSLTGRITGTPTTAGISVVTLGATNSGGTGTSTLTITVAPTSVAPIITSPTTAVANVGTPFVTYLIAATGLPTSYTAFNLPPGLSLNSLTGAINGTPTAANTTFVTLTATNAAGTGTATLMIVIAPAVGTPIITSPTSAPGTIGTPFVTYLIAATGLPTSYSATGLPPGLTLNSLTGAINGTPTTPGTYVVTLTATNAIGSSTATLTITIAPVASSRIVNFSARALSGPLDQTLIMGFVVAGNNKNLLVRGIGPGLTSFGVANALADPLLTLYNRTSAFATNDDWQTGNDGALIAATAARVGAFPLASGSKDSALLAVLNDGAHTTGLLRPNSTTGIALTEIYDTDANPGARLINVSARMLVGTNENVLTAGFVIAGNTPKTVLIRGVGPTLAVFGVAGALVDPTIAVFSGSTQTATNDDWGTGSSTAAQISGAAASVGAFALPAGSRDAALLITLQPGAYTVRVTGVGNTTGVALVEVYDTQ